MKQIQIKFNLKSDWQLYDNLIYWRSTIHTHDNPSLSFHLMKHFPTLVHITRSWTFYSKSNQLKTKFEKSTDLVTGGFERSSTERLLEAAELLYMLKMWFIMSFLSVILSRWGVLMISS